MSSPHRDWMHNPGITATMLWPTELISGCCFTRSQRDTHFNPAQELKVKVSHPNVTDSIHSLLLWDTTLGPQSILQGEMLLTPGVIALFSFLRMGTAGTRKVFVSFCPLKRILHTHDPPFTATQMLSRLAPLQSQLLAWQRQLLLLLQ